MEPSQRSDDDDEGGAAKLFPEWSVNADDQVILAGLAAFAGLLLFFGWNVWRGGDDDVASVASSVLAAPGAVVDDGASIGDDFGGGVAGPVVAAGDSATTSTTEAAADANATTSTTESETTTSTSDATTSTTEAAAAEPAGADVEAGVLDALDGAGVIAAAAAVDGTSVTVSGTIQSEAARQPAIDAAAGVEGVTNVVDQLVVSVAADLNELPQVQFATGSAEILPESFADLDEAAELILSAGDVELDIVGWTDIQGDEQANRQLSQDRALAVRQYLIEAGVDGAQLAAIGNGETEQFGAGDSPEALQANRVVLFEQTG